MTGRDKFTLVLLVLMSIFLFADQRIMSAILPEISAEFGLGRQQLGFIGSAFTLVGAFMSIGFGWFTDRISRKWLLVLVVAVGEIPCFMTGLEFFTPNAASFIILRILTGIGVGGIYPLTFSLIGDYFSEEHRATASAFMGLAWAVGMIGGPAIAGFLSPSLGWRAPFMIAAAPNFPLVILFAFTASEPRRGRAEAALEDLEEYNPRITWRDFKKIFTNRTNLYTFLQGIPGTIPWGVLGYWLIFFLETERHLPKAAATLVFTLMGAGTTIGAILFAFWGERLYKAKPSRMPIMVGFGILAGIIPVMFAINLPISNPSVYYVLAFIAGLLVSTASANVKAILMNVNHPERRGSVFAVFNITDNLGQGFGPAIGGVMMAMTSTIFALNFAALWWIPCGLLFLLIAKTLGADRDALLKDLEARAELILETTSAPY
jgi:MFS family permease